MKNTQKIFTVKIYTTSDEVNVDTIREFISESIVNSEYSDNFTFSVDKKVDHLYNFLTSNKMAFQLFLRETEEEFLKRYPYFAEEYDFCLAEFNKNPQEALINFLEETKNKEDTEPYYLTPDDFAFAVGIYIKNHMSETEQAEFLKLAESKGLQVVFY